MKKLNLHERQAKIIELLSDRGGIKIAELAKYFNVSHETIRRDLNALTASGTIKKWFGGAFSNQENPDFTIQELEQKMTSHAAAKQLICQKALEFIPPKASIFVDNGSTALYFARLLKNLSGYTVITPSLPVVNACVNSSNQMIMCGGVIDPLTMSARGAPTVDFLKQLKTDVAILGTDGFKLSDGPTGNNFEYSQVKKIAFSNAQTRIVLADSSKATYSSLIQFAQWKDINYLITDSAIDPAIRKKIEKMTEVIIQDSES